LVDPDQVEGKRFFDQHVSSGIKAADGNSNVRDRRRGDDDAGDGRISQGGHPVGDGFDAKGGGHLLPSSVAVVTGNHADPICAGKSADVAFADGAAADDEGEGSGG